MFLKTNWPRPRPRLHPLQRWFDHLSEQPTTRPEGWGIKKKHNRNIWSVFSQQPNQSGIISQGEKKRRLCSGKHHVFFLLKRILVSEEKNPLRRNNTGVCFITEKHRYRSRWWTSSVASVENVRKRNPVLFWSQTPGKERAHKQDLTQFFVTETSAECLHLQLTFAASDRCWFPAAPARSLPCWCLDLLCKKTGLSFSFDRRQTAATRKWSPADSQTHLTPPFFVALHLWRLFLMEKRDRFSAKTAHF